jgi:hypothetical protein
LIRLLRCGFVGAAAFLFVARIGAQSSTVETPEANPGRPTVSTPATLTPVGYLQFENGGLYAETSPEFTTLSGINQVTKLTVASGLQLLALSAPLAHASRATGDALSGSRPGEVFAGFQAVVLSGEGHKPAVSLSYIRRLYASPAPEIDIGTFRNSALILLSDDLAGFHFDINGIFSEQTKGIIRRGQFGQTLSISHPLGRLTVSGELWHFTQPLINRNAVGNLWAVSYPVRKNLVVDAGFDHGLTFLDAVGRVCGLHVSFASPTVAIPRSKINLMRDQLSLPHLQWFQRHLGNENRASTVINSDIQNILIRTNHVRCHVGLGTPLMDRNPRHS